MTDDLLERTRAICMALPEVTERLSHGSPTWFIRGKKTFVTYVDHHHGVDWIARVRSSRSSVIAPGPAPR